MLAAGKFDKRIRIDQPVEVRGADYADVQRTWSEVATVWAAVEPLNGRELERFRELGSDLSVRVRIRYSATVAGVSPKMRVVYGARTFEIGTVINPLEAGVELHLICSEFRHG